LSDPIPPSATKKAPVCLALPAITG